MPVEFFTAKDGTKSARANGVLLHSSYRPGTEAERFCQTLGADFNPKYIIVLEPGLSYLAFCLRKKFPGCKIGVIRFSDAFESENRDWDFALCASKGSSTQTDFLALGDQLYNLLGEEGLFQTLFAGWPASSRAFPKESSDAWKEIKAALEKAKSVLGTREFFERRWILNKVDFFSRVKKTVGLKKIGLPCAICASGPSLLDSIPFIEKKREKLFVAALSSATSVLLHHGIVPDICISTDGGFWAKSHLRSIEKNPLKKTIPLAVSTEAAIPSRLFEKCPIVPLCYDDDDFSKKMFFIKKMPFHFAKRNGTVSGTALELFLGLCQREIFFLGLDLCAGTSFSHSQPNELEVFQSQKDTRLFTKEGRVFRGNLPSKSLEVYRAWFCAFCPPEKKVFRITGKTPFKNRLGKICDIDLGQAEKIILGGEENVKENGGLFFSNETNFTGEKSASEQLMAAFLEWTKTEGFKKEVFPLDYILYSRAKSQTEKEKYRDAICKKTEELFFKISRKFK